MLLTRQDVTNHIITKNALKDNELVFFMKQRKTPVMTHPGPWGKAVNGYCMGLVLAWLSVRMGKQSNCFEVDGDNICHNPSPWYASQLQNIYMNIPDPGEEVSRKTGKPSSSKEEALVRKDDWEILAYVGMRILNSRLISIFNTEDISAHIASKPEYYYLSMHGHALAVQYKHKSYQLFDPNYGHFSLTGLERFKQWLRLFLRRSNYQNRYTWVTLFHLGQ